MYLRGSKYYANWLDIEGIRHRKAFDDADGALAHEHLQSAIKFATRAGRAERAAEFWSSFDVAQQPLNALTEAAGWPPFTVEEVAEGLSEATKCGKREVVPLGVSEGPHTRRGIMLNIILSGLLKSDYERRNSLEDSPKV